MLKLVKPGPVTRQGVVKPGPGWVNVTGGNPQDLGNPYWAASGITHVTVTAWNCDGVRLIHWGGDGEITSSTAGKAHTLSAVMDLTSNNAVIRVNNPTDKTKLIVNMQPLSLSLSLRSLYRRLCEVVSKWL